LTIKQIKVGFDNFSYVIFCSNKKEAAIVDPGFDGNKPLNYLLSNDLKLKYIILTHHHSDHTADIDIIKRRFPSAKTVSSKEDGGVLDVDISVSDGDELKIGNVSLIFILTPGHTPDGISIIVNCTALITGDTLFIGDCGRCDLSGGSFSKMFDSLQKIKKLPDQLIIYPGHNYGSKPFDTLGNQKKTNKTLIAKNLEEFSIIN
jgi:glyoxylase-like metal-dependent hydrolase (beta-lactamase superfamily II)